MANPDHLTVLQKGIKIWNAWRSKHPAVQPDLRWVNLSLENLRGADFSEARFDRTNLSGAMLSQATLNAASLRQASLSEANFSSARLDKANLSRANLSRANFSRATLRSADLSGANLSQTNLFEADLSRASFDETHFYQTLFGNTRLSGTSGLEASRHLGPSILDHHTLAQHPHLPARFLRGCGLQAWEIEAVTLYDPMLHPEQITAIVHRIQRLRTEHAIQHHNLFLSYSYADLEFVEHLETHLIRRDILAWRDEHDTPKKRQKNIVIRSMRPNPTVLLVFSAHSVEHNWVDYEIDQARKLEETLRRNVLCLITLDDSWQTHTWSEGLADQIVQYPILDFSNWQDPEVFADTFDRLVDRLDVFHKTPTPPQGTETPKSP